MRLNLLQHLTDENFHKTHNFYVLFVMISPLKIKTITMAVMGLFGRSRRHTKGNFEEKKDNGLRIDEQQGR